MEPKNDHNNIIPPKPPRARVQLPTEVTESTHYENVGTPQPSFETGRDKDLQQQDSLQGNESKLSSVQFTALESLSSHDH